jgi:hypothetical protein
MALLSLVWVLSQSLGLIKEGKIEQEARRRGDKRRKALISIACHGPSANLDVVDDDGSSVVQFPPLQSGYRP